jgi:hypothetical protein
MKNLLISLALVILAPIAAFAEEGGVLTLEIEGAVYEFPLNAGQSDWGGTQAYGSVNIYSRPTDEATWALFKQLTLGFTLQQTVADAPEISLNRMVGDEMEKLFGNAEAGAEVTLDEVITDGDFLTISGSFKGDLGTSRNYGGDIDLSEPVPISGTFVVTLLSINAE